VRSWCGALTVARIVADFGIQAVRRPDGQFCQLSVFGLDCGCRIEVDLRGYPPAGSLTTILDDTARCHDCRIVVVPDVAGGRHARDEAGARYRNMSSSPRPEPITFMGMPVVPLPTLRVRESNASLARYEDYYRSLVMGTWDPDPRLERARTPATETRRAAQLPTTPPEQIVQRATRSLLAGEAQLRGATAGTIIVDEVGALSDVQIARAATAMLGDPNARFDAPAPVGFKAPEKKPEEHKDRFDLIEIT
jgi:hypothetical protein